MPGTRRVPGTWCWRATRLPDTYAGRMSSWSSTRITAVLAACFAALAVVLIASVSLLNPPPEGASCYTADGYAAMKAHAEANVTLALFALLSTAVCAVICLVGALRAAGYRLGFALAMLPLLVLGMVCLTVVIAWGLYCQN